MNISKIIIELSKVISLLASNSLELINESNDTLILDANMAIIENINNVFMATSELAYAYKKLKLEHVAQATVKSPEILYVDLPEIIEQNFTNVLAGIPANQNPDFA